VSSKGAQYRRRARECLEIALTLAPGLKRATLTDIAQTWLRLAEEQEATNLVGDQPMMQQQQIQPKDDGKKE